jgi:colanic acid/amylovoran biosynthesis glycosyltransferase
MTGGPLRRQLEEARRSLLLTNEVTLLGPLPYPAVLEQLAWADVLVFTGKIAADGDRDGVPNVVLEAMAAGVPVAATRVGGVPEAIEDGVTGVLIEDAAPTDWVVALSRLGSEDGHYESLSRAARAWVEANCDGRVTTRQLYERFAAIAEATRAPAEGVMSRGYKPVPHL